MKMPRRPLFFPGTSKPRPDIFGLHHVTIAGAASSPKADNRHMTLCRPASSALPAMPAVCSSSFLRLH